MRRTCLAVLVIALCLTAAAANQSFFAMAAKGDVTGISAALAQEPGLVNARDEHGRTALDIAVYFNRAETADVLLKHGATMSLWNAAALGKTGEVRRILDQGNSLDAKDANGRTPVLWAALRNQSEMVRMLVGRGAHVDIFVASAAGMLNKMRELVDHAPALLEAKSAEELTPLRYAVMAGQHEGAELLLSLGANPNSSNQFGTALFDAARKGDTAMVKLLLAHRADKNFLVPGLGRAFNAAQAAGHQEVASVLKP